MTPAWGVLSSDRLSQYSPYLFLGIGLPGRFGPKRSAVCVENPTLNYALRVESPGACLTAVLLAGGLPAGGNVANHCPSLSSHGRVKVTLRIEMSISQCDQ